MSQIEFTSACAGDIGVTLMDEVIAIAFIKKNPEDMVARVDIYDIRKGGAPILYANLADALDYMLKLADLYRTMDLEAQIKMFHMVQSRLGPNIKYDRNAWDEWADDYSPNNKEH